jgi:hypothetical protein
MYLAQNKGMIRFTTIGAHLCGKRVSRCLFLCVSLSLQLSQMVVKALINIPRHWILPLQVLRVSI